MPLSRPGLIIALLYMAAAIFILLQERTQPGGDWISLRGMGTYLATLPISLPAEFLGMKLDFRRNLDMGFAITGCAALIYALVWLVSKIKLRAYI